SNQRPIDYEEIGGGLRGLLMPCGWGFVAFARAGGQAARGVFAPARGYCRGVQLFEVFDEVAGELGEVVEVACGFLGGESVRAAPVVDGADQVVLTLLPGFEVVGVFGGASRAKRGALLHASP